MNVDQWLVSSLSFVRAGLGSPPKFGYFSPIWSCVESICALTQYSYCFFEAFWISLGHLCMFVAMGSLYSCLKSMLAMTHEFPTIPRTCIFQNAVLRYCITKQINVGARPVGREDINKYAPHSKNEISVQNLVPIKLIFVSVPWNGCFALEGWDAYFFPIIPFSLPIEILPIHPKIVCVCNRHLREAFNYLALIQFFFLKYSKIL